MKRSSFFPWRGCRVKRSVTLVELVIAMLVLLTLVIAGASFFLYSKSRIALERNRRAAIEIATGRAELLLSSVYADIKPVPADDWDTHYIKRVGEDWLVDSSDDETVTINNLTLPITTTVAYVDKNDDPPNSFDYILAVVRVGYRLIPDERVELRTYIGPY